MRKTVYVRLDIEDTEVQYNWCDDTIALATAIEDRLSEPETVTLHSISVLEEHEVKLVRSTAHVLVTFNTQAGEQAFTGQVVIEYNPQDDFKASAEKAVHDYFLDFFAEDTEFRDGSYWSLGDEYAVTVSKTTELSSADAYTMRKHMHYVALV